MSGGTYIVQLKDREVAVTSRELESFRDRYLEACGLVELARRMSELVWLDIYTVEAAFGVSPQEILSAINDVEHGETVSRIKAATQFENMPLKGLWHKHYFSARFMPQNIVLGLSNGRLSKLVKEVIDPGKSPLISKERITELAWRVAGIFKTRSAAKQLTGEWIVYMRRETKNYYLCCSTHEDGDQFIYDRIMEHCVRDFPELPTWLKDQQHS
jgi:hypothetical protein